MLWESLGSSGMFSDALMFQEEKLVCMLDFSLFELTFVHLTDKWCPQQHDFLIISGCISCVAGLILEQPAGNLMTSIS